MHIIRKILGIPIEAPLVLRALVLLYVLPYVGVWFYMPLMHYVGFQCLCDESPGGIVSDTIVLLFNVIWLYGFTIVFIYSLRLARQKGFLPVFEKFRWRDLTIFILPIHTLIYRLGDFFGGMAGRYSRTAMILWSGVTVCAIAALVSGWYYLFLPAVLLYPLDFWLVSRTLTSAADPKWRTAWKWFTSGLAVTMIGIHMTLFGWTFVIDRQTDAVEQDLTDEFGYSIAPEGVKAYYLKGLTPNYQPVFGRSDFTEELEPFVERYARLSDKEYEVFRKWLVENQEKITQMDELIGQGYIKDDRNWMNDIFKAPDMAEEFCLWSKINTLRIKLALHDKDSATVTKVLLQYRKIISYASEGISYSEIYNTVKVAGVELNKAFELVLENEMLTNEFITDFRTELMTYKNNWLERYKNLFYLEVAELYETRRSYWDTNGRLDRLIFFERFDREDECHGDMRSIAGRLLTAPMYVAFEKTVIDYYLERLAIYKEKREAKFLERREINQYLLIVALNVELFRQKYGRVPDKLEELVPEFMGSVPIDPMDGKALRYQKGMIEVRNYDAKKVEVVEDDLWAGLGNYSEGSRAATVATVELEGWRIYSVGWDRVDCGGRDWESKNISFTVIQKDKR